jgi:transposase
VSKRQAKAVYWQDAPLPRGQLVLIPTALEEVIASDHPVRLVDEILDQLDWRQWESKYDGRSGQPPIHPSVLAKVLLFAMIRRIRSSRSIEYEVKHSIDFMWLTSGRRIDHTTISEFRRNNSEELRGIFKNMIKLAMDLGMANLSELCIDGTRILGNANRYKTWTSARLAKALEQLDAQLVEALKSLEENDSLNEDLFGQDLSADRLPEAVANLQERREKLAAAMETTQAMDAGRQANGTKGPAQLPKTDTDSRILPNKEGGYAANYTPMATTETVSGLIVDAEVVIGNVEHDQLSDIVDRVEAEFEAEVARVMADKAYTTGENLAAAEANGFELVGPLAETKRDNNPAERDDLTQPVPDADIPRLPINPQTKRFDKAAFVYDAEADIYYCPAGKELPHRVTENTKRGDTTVAKKVYTCNECAGCSLAGLCRTNPESERGREVKDDEYEGARRRQRARMKTEEAQAAYARRQHFGELPFAVIKVMFDMRRFLLRGIEGVGQEWRWAATAFNLKKLMSRWAELRAELANTSTAAAS